MGFEESALARLRRYREEAERSLAVQREIEETTHSFSERLFTGLERAAALGRRAGLGVEVKRERNVLVLRVEAATGAEVRLTLGLLEGVAAETDEDLMHEDSAATASIRRATQVESSAGRRRRGRQPAKPSPFMETGYGRRRASSWQRPVGG